MELSGLGPSHGHDECEDHRFNWHPAPTTRPTERTVVLWRVCEVGCLLERLVCWCAGLLWSAAAGLMRIGVLRATLDPPRCSCCSRALGHHPAASGARLRPGHTGHADCLTLAREATTAPSVAVPPCVSFGVHCPARIPLLPCQSHLLLVSSSVVSPSPSRSLAHSSHPSTS